MPKEEQRRLPHIYIPGHGNREDFTSPRSGGGSGNIPEREREQHAQRLEEMLTAAIAVVRERVANRDPEISGGIPGSYLEFELLQSQQTVLDKLEYQGKNRIELVAVRPSDDNPDLLKATVFVPESQGEYHLRKVREYADKDNVKFEKDTDGNFLLDDDGKHIEKSRRPKNETLVAALEAVRIAEANSIYTDDPLLFPALGQEIWWEIWLRSGGRPVFDHAAVHLGIATREHTVRFAEREVILARTTPETIGRIIENTDAIAELRLSRDTPAFFMEMDGAQQTAWSEDLVNRLVKPEAEAPAVCVLDSGTTRRHPLIAPALGKEDQQAWRADWHGEDISAQWGGHGTQMSGVVLYGGDLEETLIGNDPIRLVHRLESVKILPDYGSNDCLFR